MCFAWRLQVGAQQRLERDSPHGMGHPACYDFLVSVLHPTELYTAHVQRCTQPGVGMCCVVGICNAALLLGG
jgi:hypothetical protein